MLLLIHWFRMERAPSETRNEKVASMVACC